MDPARPLAPVSAADLDDSRLLALSVDPGAALRSALLAPADAAPRLLLGMRGCGKTHALRLWSWPLAGQRAPDADGLDLARADAMLAVHLRLSAFDAQRYRARGAQPAGWLAAFARQLEWRIAERLLGVAIAWRARCAGAGFDEAVWPGGAGPAPLLAQIVAARRQLDVDAARAAGSRAPQPARLASLDLPAQRASLDTPAQQHASPGTPAAADRPGALLAAIGAAWARWHADLADLPLICIVDEAEQLPAAQLAELVRLAGTAATLRWRIAGRRELDAEPAFAGWPRHCADDLLRRLPHWPVLAQALLDRRLAPGELPPLADGATPQGAVGLAALIDASAGNPGLLLGLFDRLALAVWQRGFRFGMADEESGVEAPLPAALQAEALAASARDFFEPPALARSDPRHHDARRLPAPAARDALRRLGLLIAALAGRSAPRLQLATAGLPAEAAANLAAALDAGWLIDLGSARAEPSAGPAGAAPAGAAASPTAAVPTAAASPPAALFDIPAPRQLPPRLRVALHPLVALRLELAAGTEAAPLALDVARVAAVFGATPAERFARLLAALAAAPRDAADPPGEQATLF
ncbi:ORC-CDC6 family AAA ATPase [Derxia lacustris]|uniref:ORC-CDC6 family AAA ATPase n=1 Tax=Derxia lacustris TaxID=764842 RepID=UPI000A17806F|nr:hypothetical protein [Derxia lacustris]